MTANVNVTKVLFKRGNTVQNAAYTGINGEITVDTQAKTLRIHDGVTTGGNVIVAGGVVGSYSNTNAAAYIPTDPTITSIQANVAAANAAISAITGIDTSLIANAATQQTQINLINANVSAANALIPNLLAVSGNILPAANVTYSLGSETRQWRDLWVSNNTIYIGNTPIRVDGDTLLVNGAPVGSNISTSFDLEMHVSKDGNDSTGTGTILRPYLTITHALTQVTGGRNTIVIHPGGYTENPTITSLATQLITYDATGASTLVYGTVTIANTTGRIAGLKMTNLAITGNAQAYINSSTVDEQFTKSSSGYVEVDDCELQVTGNVLISGSGITTIIGNKINNLVVNNAGAQVLIKGANDCLMPQVTAGSLNIIDSTIRASSNTANAVTASVGTVVTLMNNQIVTPTADNVARVSIAGFHSIISVVYDKANSTLSNSLNSVAYFQTANVDSLVSTGNISASQYNFANGVNILSTVAGTYANANVAEYLPTYSGNVRAEYVIMSFGGLITTGASPAPIISGFRSISTAGNAPNEGNITASGNLVASRGAYITGNVTAGNINANQYNFANGVNILTTVGGGTYGNANVAVYLPTYTGNIAANIVKNGHTWNFGTDGTTIFPGNSKIVKGFPGRSGIPFDDSGWFVPPGGSRLGGIVSADGRQYIQVNNLGGGISISTNYIDFTANTWNFGIDGNLTFPDTTIQSTAFSNSAIATYLPTYSGNIAANIVKNGYTWTFSNTGNLAYPDGTISTGGAVYAAANASVQLISNNENTQVRVDNSNVEIYTSPNGITQYQWTFGNTGNLTLPAGGVIAEGGGISGAIRLTPAGGANANQALLIYPTGVAEGDHIHLTAGGGSTELYLGNDFHYVKLVDGGNIELRAATANLSSQAAWTFDTTGNIDTIQALGIKVPDGVPTNVAIINSTTGSWEMNPQSNLATTGGTGSGLTVNVAEVGGYASTIEIATAGTGYTNGDLITVTSGTSNATFTIVIGGRNSWQFGGDGNLTLPSANFDASPAPSSSPSIVFPSEGYIGASLETEAEKFLIKSEGKTWTFDGSYEDLTFPGGTVFSSQNIVVVANANLTVTTFDGTSHFTTFGLDGNLILPETGYLRVGTGIVAGFASSPAPIISGFSSISAENFRFQGNGVNILSDIGAYQTFANANAATQATSINTINNTLTSTNVGIGFNAGATSQGTSAVAIGEGAGTLSQGVFSVAIGNDAGAQYQGDRSVAVGTGAGKTNQGDYAVAIGRNAGFTNQGNNSIIINATTGTLNQTTANTFTVAPVRNDVSNVAQVVFYNTTSKEVTYGNTISIAGNITAANFVGNISITGNVTGTSANVTLQAGAYTSVFDNQGNVTVPQLFTAGNIQTAGYFVGNALGTTAAYTGNVTVGGNLTIIGTKSNVPVKTGGFVAQNTAVSIDSITAQWLNTGGPSANQLQLAALNGNVSILYTYTFQDGTGGSTTGGSSSTTLANLSFGWTSIGNPSGVAGDMYNVLVSLPGTNAYRITAMTGSGYSDNVLTVERLV